MAEVDTKDASDENPADATVATDEDCSAFDAGLASEMKVPIVDAAQASANT